MDLSLTNKLMCTALSPEDKQEVAAGRGQLAIKVVTVWPLDVERDGNVSLLNWSSIRM